LTVAPNFEKNGVIVVETDDDSKLIPGDIIIEINREFFTTIDNFLELIDTISKTGRNSLLLKIIRDEKSLWITIKFNQ
jgi:type II secretory pathway component PulC